jgi:hypothetical protein
MNIPSERKTLTGDEQDAVVAKARKLIPVLKADPDALTRRLSPCCNAPIVRAPDLDGFMCKACYRSDRPLAKP